MSEPAEPELEVQILVVDDHPPNLLTMNELLDAPGRRVHLTESGLDALDLLTRVDVGVALLDVNMPEMDGFELARLMRGYARTSAIPILFVTAAAASTTASFEGYEAGAVDYLIKPLDPHTVESKVEVFCQLDRQRQRIAWQRAELEERNRQLQAQMAEIKTLRSLIPICSHCRKVRDDDGFWQGVESYVSSISNLVFSHGICEACLEIHYPE